MAVLLFMVLIERRLPYYWGNATVTDKLKYCKDQDLQPETVFFGNSKIYRHLIPSVFDSLTVFNGQSYNMASDATTIFETYHLVAGYLEENSPSRVFVHYSGYPGLVMHQELSLQYRYHWSLPTIHAAIGLINDKRDQLLKHLHVITGRYFKFGEGKSILFNLSSDNTDFVDNGGYTSLDTSYPERVGQLHKRFPKFIHSLIKAKKKSFKRTLSKEGNMTLNSDEEILHNHFNRYNVLSEKHKVEIYIIFFPNQPMYYKTNFRNSIYMGDGKDFPTYFDDKYYFDKGHFNHKGAKMFTTRLAEVINKNNSPSNK